MKKFQYTLMLFFLCIFAGRAQFTVNPVIKHANPYSVPGTGSINLLAGGGTAPYSFTWNPGSITTADLSSVSVGAYSLHAEDNAASTIDRVYRIGYKALWTHLENLTFSGDSLKVVNNYFYPNTAVSKNTLPAGTNGWAQVVVTELDNSYVMGFTDSLSPFSHSRADIDFGFSLSYTNLYFVQNGSYSSLLAGLGIGDVVTIERSGSVFGLSLNGVSVYTVSMPSDKAYRLKIAMEGSYLSNIGTSFRDTTNAIHYNYVRAIPVITHCTPGSSNGGVKLSARYAGPYTYTWTPGNFTTSVISGQDTGTYHVVLKDANNNQSEYNYHIGYKTNWTPYKGLTLRNDSLFYNGLPYSGYHEALSKNTLTANADGWVEYAVTNDFPQFFMGFLDSASTVMNNHYDIDHGVFFSNNSLYYIQNGFPTILHNCYGGEVVRIQRSGSAFSVLFNSVLSYSITVDPTKNWKLKVMLPYGSANNIGCSFTDSTGIAFSGYVENKIHVKHSSGLHITDGRIELSPIEAETGYTYTWSPGGSTSAVLSNRQAGNYQVTIQDTLGNTSSYNYNILHEAKWTELDGTSFSNDTLTSVPPYNTITGWSTASTKNILKAGEDGEISWINDNISYNIIGFADTLSNVSGTVNDIDYGIYTSGNYIYYITYSAYYYLGEYKANSLLQLKRRNDTVFVYINGSQNVAFPVANSGVDWRVKAAIAASYSMNDVGCSFVSPLTATFDVQHVDLSVGPFSGSVSVTPFGGTGPYSVEWGLDAVQSHTRTNMSQGSYSVIIIDSTGNDRVLQVVNIGVMPNFGSVINASVAADTIYSINSASMGILVSSNIVDRNDQTWFEGTITSLNHDVAIGFISVTNTMVTPTPPSLSDPEVISARQLADTLMQMADAMTLQFNIASPADSIIELPTRYEEVHMMRLKNGKMRSLESGSSYAAYYTYTPGDEVRIGRTASNKIYLAINDNVVYTHPTALANKYLVPVVVINNPIGLTKKNIFLPQEPNGVIIVQKYAMLKRRLDAGYYQINMDGRLYFKYDAEYNNGPLDYKVYNEYNTVLSLASLTKNYGDNRYSLNVSGLSNGYYFLEVTNEKNEVFKLKFKK